MDLAGSPKRTLTNQSLQPSTRGGPNCDSEEWPRIKSFVPLPIEPKMAALLAVMWFGRKILKPADSVRTARGWGKWAKRFVDQASELHQSFEGILPFEFSVR